jgi:hypothetical protein
MKLTAAERFSRSEIAELLARYEGLHILPSIGTTTSIVGTIAFRAEGRATPLIEDSYEVRIEVPENVPERMALVWETAGRIPATFHRLDNRALCLGSRVRLRLQMAGSSSVLRFVERCLIPYLYGYSHYERTGVMPFGELHHGELGSLQDLAGLLQVELADAAPYCVLASMQRRRANKQPCPCHSGRRLGRCHNRKVNTLRQRVGRVFLRREMLVIAAAIREARVQKAATPPARTLDWRDVLRDITSRPALPTWAMPIGQSQSVLSPTP